MAKPKVFVASSGEKLDLAYAVQQELERDADVTLWPQGIMRLSRQPLEALLLMLDRTDCGIFIFATDDISLIRKKTYTAVRDNVLIEFGLFVGRLGRGRAFLLQPELMADARIPTDMLGLIPATYDDRRTDNLRAAVGPACSQIRQELRGLNSLSSLIEGMTLLEGRGGYLKTAPRIYDHALRLYGAAEQRVRVLQAFPGPRPPRGYAQKAANILRNKKRQQTDVLFEAYLAFDFDHPPAKFKENNDARYKVYEKAGLEDRVSVYVVDVKLPTFDMFIVDRKHAHISFTT